MIEISSLIFVVEVMMKILVFYLIAVNIAAILIMGIDKHRSRRNKWRISEKSIFITGVAGGGLGVIFGMVLFRHKTRHLKFTLGVPLIVILNIVTVSYLVQRFK